MGNLTEFAIGPFESRADSIFHGIGNLSLDQAGGKRTEGLVKKVVTTITNGKLEGINLDVDGLDTEETALGLLGGGLVVDDGDGGGDTASAKEDICETRVFEFLYDVRQH
jgi:hypothetical protein